MDLQELIPAKHRDIVEAAPRGFMRSSAVGGLLMGALFGSTVCLVVSNWVIPAVFGALLLVQRIWVWRSDRDYDRCVAALKDRGFEWKDSADG